MANLDSKIPPTAQKQFPLTQYVLGKSKLFWVFLVLTFMLGINTYQNIPKEWAPDVKVPFLIVSTAFPGASPIDTERLITRRLELEFNGIEGIKNIKSTSTEGVSIITVEFFITTDLKTAKDELKDAIDLAKPDLPEDALDPTLTEINFSEFPVFVLNLASDLDADEFRNIAEDIQEDLEAIVGVLSVNLFGVPDREMQVFIDPAKLSYYRVSIDDVTGAIRNNNNNVPAGSIEVGTVKIPVRLQGEINNVNDLENIVISAQNDQPIYIKDISQKVILGNKDAATLSRLDGKETISISISKRAGENLQYVVSEINKVIEKWKARFGNQIQFAVIDDQSIEVDRKLDEILNNIIVGFLLVVLVLMVVMGFFNSAMVAMAIPLSILMGLIVLSIFGISLNMVVLFSLIMTLGLVVDDAIVVVENVYRHLQMGREIKDALRIGVYEVAWPVITSTLTALASFFPLIFIPGIMGDFMKYLPFTMIATLLSSLFVALVFNPLMCSFFMKKPDSANKNIFDDERLAVSNNRFFTNYQKILRWALNNNYKVIFSVIGLFVLAIWFYGFVLSPGSEFFPKDEPSQASINIVAPYGANLSESDRLTRKIESVIEKYTEHTRNVLVNIGGGGNGGFRGGESNSNSSEIKMLFLPWQERQKDPSQVIEEIDKTLKQDENRIAGAKILISTVNAGPPSGKPVNIEIKGESLTVLKTISNDIQALVAGTKGLINLDDDLTINQNNITIIPNRLLLADYNLNINSLGQAVRTAISGSSPSNYRVGKDQYDIVVRFPEDTRKSVEDIKRIPIVTQRGVIPLDSIAQIKIALAPGSIRHVDRVRTLTLSGDSLNVSGTNLLAEIKEKIAGYQPPDGYTISYTGEEESRNEISEYMPKAFLLALFMIFILMAWEFNSISSPFVILATVFLSIIGVVIGLIVHNAPYSIVLGSIGVVSLAGIVAKNGIVLIDYIKYKRAQGMELKESIVLACMLRIRPIFLTAITAILALMPILIGMDINFFRWPNIISFEADGTEIWKPLANAIIYGLAISTMLTLLFVPCMYYLIESEHKDGPLHKRTYKKLRGYLNNR